MFYCFVMYIVLYCCGATIRGENEIKIITDVNLEMFSCRPCFAYRGIHVPV